jgi:uncharacterized membrane protein YfcA
MISVGLAELQDYHLMARCRVPSPVAVATSIFVVLFTVPGVISGGQLGPFLQTRVNAEMVKRGVSLIFMLIGLFMLITII